MNTLTYKGYTARIEFDERDNLLVGRVLGVPERISFHGENAVELRADFEAAIDFYLADCAKTGRAPTLPTSGKMMLRVPPEVHSAAVGSGPSGRHQPEPMGRQGIGRGRARLASSSK